MSGAFESVLSTKKGKEIIKFINNSPKISRVVISTGRIAGGEFAVTGPISDPTNESFIKRLTGFGKNAEITYTLQVTLDINHPDQLFYDVNGKEFQPSIDRVLGHELGHAFILAKDGVVGFYQNQIGAVNIENEIALDLDKGAPIRHPTLGHGRRSP